MICLYKPYIKSKNNKSRLIFDIEINKIKKTIWFEVDSIYKKYLCNDRVDAIVVGILNYAMKYNHDIKSDSYITEELLYKLENYLIPSLTKYSKLNNIKINIKTKKTVKNYSGVGTGCSCGIDSMHAILSHLNSKSKQYKLTHLCINNVGSFNECYEEAGIEKVKNTRIDAAKKFSKEINLPIIITNSNIAEEIIQPHNLTHTYSSTFAILCMQKLWSTYYYGSSGEDFSLFSIKNNDEKDCSKYELLSLQCFSTNNLTIYSDGGAINRLEKTKAIANNEFVQKYLHVCTKEEYNCGICPKCMRTILSLYSLNINLNKYKKVFDIKYFNENKNEYFEWIYNEHVYCSTIIEPIYNKLLEKQDFKNFVASKGEEKILSLNPKYYEYEYNKIVNSKSFKVTNIILDIPRKIIRLIKGE